MWPSTPGFARKGICTALLGALLALLAAASAQAGPWRDSDGDGVRDSRDNCPALANADQRDKDRDGVGDACDSDRDGDNVANDRDNCPDTTNRNQSDSDRDGLGDACDPDRDGDGRANTQDNCADAANANQRDSDGDGVGDACDATPYGDPSPDSQEPDGGEEPPVEVEADATESKIVRKRRGPVAPRLSSLSMSRRTAIVCLSRSRRARRRCRARRIAIVYSLDRAATVRATLSRWTCQHRRCGWRSLGFRDVQSIRGRSAFTIGERFRGKRLRHGRHRLELTAREDGLTSSPVSATFRVRG
jgi:hypothetical protein